MSSRPRPGGAPAARRARRDDAPALVRLRAVMFETVQTPDADPDRDWQGAAEAWFAAQLAQPAAFAAFVVDDPVLGLVSAACGICDARAPGPRGLSGVRGHVFGIATDPRRRRRGYARACVGALLAWFAQDTPAEIVELSATAEGAPLYASLGFRERDRPTMRLVIERPPARPAEAAPATHAPRDPDERWPA